MELQCRKHVRPSLDSFAVVAFDSFYISFDICDQEAGILHFSYICTSMVNDLMCLLVYYIVVSL